MSMNTYIYFRADGFYPVEAPDDATAIHMGWLNPGTLKIETMDGKELWTPPKSIPFAEDDPLDWEDSRVTVYEKGKVYVKGPIYTGWFTYDDAVKSGLVTPSPLYKPAPSPTQP